MYSQDLTPTFLRKPPFLTISHFRSDFFISLLVFKNYKSPPLLTKKGTLCLANAIWKINPSNINNIVKLSNIESDTTSADGEVFHY